jgi:hypothetical protein
MSKARELVITKLANGVAVEGRCARCQRPFETHATDTIKANEELMALFADHVCNEDINQAAARVVREATERK